MAQPKKCAVTGKRVIPTQKEAQMAVNRMRKRSIMNVYGCRSCGGWHLGRSNDAARNANWIGVLLKRHEKDLEKRNGKNKRET